MNIESDKISDKIKLMCYMCVGAPGAGKGTWASGFLSINKNILYISTDSIRKELSGDESNQSVSAQAFKLAKQRLEDALKNNKSVIIDAANMYRKTRKDFLDIAKKYNAETIAIVFEVDKNTLLDRNKKRGEQGGRNVPEWVIDSMISKYQRPDTTEFDIVKFI